MTKYEKSVGIVKIIRNLFASIGFAWVMLTAAIWLVVCIPSVFLVPLSDDVTEMANKFSDRMARDVGYEKVSAETEEEP